MILLFSFHFISFFSLLLLTFFQFLFSPMEKQLIESLLSGHVEGVEALLKDHPDFNVNWGDEIKRTALHAASLNGQTEVVKLLLARQRSK